MKYPIDKDAVRRAAEWSTKASAELADRVVPEDSVRSERVEKFLAERFKQHS